MKWHEVKDDQRFLSSTPEQQSLIMSDWFKNNIESKPQYKPEMKDVIWQDIFGIAKETQDRVDTQAGIKPPRIVEPEYPERPEYEEPPPSARAAGWQPPTKELVKVPNRVSEILKSVGYEEPKPTEPEIIKPEYEPPLARGAGWQPPTAPLELDFEIDKVTNDFSALQESLASTAVESTRGISKPEKTPLAFQPTSEKEMRIGIGEQLKRIDWQTRIPFSPVGLIKTADLYLATKRVQKDDYPETFIGEDEKFYDKQLIENYLEKRWENEIRGKTFGAKTVEGVSILPAWMIEFIATGGLYNLGKTGAIKAGEKLLGKYAKRRAGKLAIKGTGWALGSAVRTVAMPHRAGEAILERQIPEEMHFGAANELSIEINKENWATSIAKGWGSTFIEVASEATGGALIKGGLKVLNKIPFGKQLIKGLEKSWLKLNPDKTATEFATKLFKKGGYDGIVGEVGEERVATLMHAIANTYDFGAGKNSTVFERLSSGITQDLQNFPVEAAVLSVPMAGKYALAKVMPSPKAVPIEKIPLQEPAKPPVAATEMPKVEQKAVVKDKVLPVDKDGGDLVDMDGVPMKVNTDGTVTLYHRTTPEKAKGLRKTGKFISLENRNETFFSNKIEGQGEGYGDAIIAVKVKPSQVGISDAFHNGEIHVTVSNKLLSKENILPEIKGEIPVTKVPVAEKQPWEMTKTEYRKASKELYDKLGNELFVNSDFRKYSEDVPHEYFGESMQKFPNNSVNQAHYRIIKHAVSEDKPIPAEVLKDYPDLVKPEVSVEPIKTTVVKKPWKKTKKEIKFDKCYGVSSVPYSYSGNLVKITGLKDVNFAVYQTKSGWLLSKIINNNEIKTYGGERAGVGRTGYETPKKAIEEGYAEVLKDYPELAKPTEKVEPMVISKELEPLAKEAKRVKSFNEFYYQENALRKIYKPIIDKVDNISVSFESTCVDCEGGAEFVERQMDKAIEISKTGKWAKKIKDTWANRLKDYDTTLYLTDEYLIFQESAIENFYKLSIKPKTIIPPIEDFYNQVTKAEKVEFTTIPKKPSAPRVTGKIRIPSKALEGEGFPALKSIFGAKVARKSESGAIIKDYGQIKGVTVGGKTILNIESWDTNYDILPPEAYKISTDKDASFDEILDEAHNEIDRFERGEISKTGKILKEKLSAKELFEAEEWGKTEEMRIKEAVTEVGGLNPEISKSGKTVRFIVPGIGIKTVMRTKDIHYDDVAERIDKRLREHEIPEEQLELLNKKKKLRQRIHAFVSIKGMTNKQFRDIVKAKTLYKNAEGEDVGYRSTTNKKITVEQLEKILKSVKRTRPPKIGYKVVIKPKTEKRIRELKERFTKEGYITEKTYQDILKRMNIREPFYANKNQFITNKQGLELIRSLFRKTPTIREFYGKEILDIPDRTIRDWREYNLTDPQLIRDSKQKVFKREIKEKETLLTRFLRNFSSVERWAEIIQRKTEKNIYDLTENLSRNQGYFELALEREMQKLPEEYLTLNIEERELITNWRTGEDVQLSDRALKVAKSIVEYYDSDLAQTLLKVNRFQQWLENPARISIKGVSEKRLNELKTIWEEEGNLGLIYEIKKTEGFTIKKDYKPDITLSNSFPLYSAPGVGKSLLQSKLGKGIEIEKDALIAFERKLRSDFKILYLNDAIKEMSELLYEEDLPNHIKGDIRTLLINYSIGLQQGSLEKVLEWNISQIIKTALSNPLKWARNYPQRSMILPYTPLHLMPKMFFQVMRRSFLRGSIRINKGKTWKKASETKKNSFLAHTTEESALEHEFMGMKRHKILVKLGWLGKICKKYITVYGGVDTSSRWSIFDPVSINIMRAFEQGKSFRKMKGVLYWEHIPTELKNILRAEIDNKNYEYVALRIAEHMAATKTQWRYGRHEKSIHEQTSGGHLLLRVTTYGRSTIHQYIDDAKTCGEGVLNKDKNKFYKGFQAIVLRTALMYAIAKALLRVFGKKKKWGYGWNPLEVLDVEAAGLIDAVTDLWGGIKDPVFMMTKQLLNKHILGTITNEELDKVIGSESKKLLKGIDAVPYRTIIGYRQILWMLESVYGVEKIRPLSDAYNKVVHDKGWEEKEIERNAWQTLRHTIFGTDTEEETSKKPEKFEPYKGIEK